MSNMVNFKQLKSIWETVRGVRKTKRYQIVKRIFICFVILLSFYLFATWLLTPPESTWPVFSFKTGEFSCDTNKECIKMAKEKTIKNWENQKQLFEYVDRWSQFVGFSILTLRYDISFENRSYNQIETTGPMGEKRQLPAKVICAENPFIEIWSKPILEIKRNVALNDVYSQMELLLGKFDGCYFDLTYMNYSVNDSLGKDRLVVGPNEYVKLSNEQEFVFPVKLDSLSHLFIVIQLILLLPVLLIGPKPVLKFIFRGKAFFDE